MSLELLFPHFDELIRTPEDVQRLNEAILQLAVQGKLVPQDPNDEPAKELLKKIEISRRQLNQTKQIDKVRRLRSVQASEHPFTLPVDWSVVRLGALVSKLGAGSTPLGGKKVYQADGIKFIRSQNVWNSGLRLVDVAHISDKINSQMSNTEVMAKDILLNITGASIGRSAVVPDDFDVANVNQHVAIVRLIEPKIRRFVHLVVMSSYFQQLIMDAEVGISRAGLSMTRLQHFVIPLPPLAEQYRIVAKVDELFAQTRALEARLREAQEDVVTVNRAALHRLHTVQDDDQFQTAWHTIRDHFDVLYDDPRNVAELRQTILDLAVRGKLVPQNPNDEPAEELLIRIKEEKARHASGGNAKVRKSLPPIDPETVSFQLPSSWTWARSAEVGVINPRNNVDADTWVSFIPMALINDGIGGGHSAKEMLWRDVRSGFTHFAENDVGIAKITPCFQNRKSTVFEELTNGVGAGTTELHIFRPVGGYVLSKYALLFFQSPEFVENGKASMTGTAGQQRVPRSYVEEAPFPLPPLAEQHRIVAKVDHLMRLCDALEAGLARSETNRSTLTQAVLHQVAT